MASKNIVLKGTTYNGVESITLPTSPNGTATFCEISDTTATAADVDSSKWFYTALGVLTQGTASGGGGGGSGLVYEAGTWSPSEDVANYVISLTNTHAEAPFFYMISDASGDYDGTTNSCYMTTYFNYAQYAGQPMYQDEGDPYYAVSVMRYRGSSATSLSMTTLNIAYPYTDPSSGQSSYCRYWATETGIRAYTNNSSRYWRNGRTYKWIAVWRPTT